MNQWRQGHAVAAASTKLDRHGNVLFVRVCAIQTYTTIRF